MVFINQIKRIKIDFPLAIGSTNGSFVGVKVFSFSTGIDAGKNKTRSLAKIPSSTYFNLGKGNNYYFIGSQTQYTNYKYPLDFDSFILPIKNPINLPNKRSMKSQSIYEYLIDSNDSFMGTSCLHIISKLNFSTYFA